MPDYASILERSIETLPEKTPDMRQAVYERARAALARQLTSVDPPLSPESIESQHQHLEEAILAVEADFSPPDAGGGMESGEAVEYSGVPTETELAGGYEQELADTLAYSGEPSQGVDPDIPETDDTAPEGAEFEPEPSNKRWEQPKVSHAPALIMALLFGLIAIGAAVFAFTQWESVQAFIDDLTGKQMAVEAPAGEDGEQPAAADGNELAVAPKSEDRLLEGIPAPLDGAQVTSPSGDAAGQAPADSGASEMAGQPTVPAPGDSGGSQTAAGETPAAEIPAPEPVVPVAPTGTETAASESPVTEPPAAQLPAGTETVDAVPQGLVGQRAIFEEQGAEGAPGKSVAGVVAWSQKTKEGGLPAIVGVIELPDRNAAMSLTITKNTDQALPASHLIEIEFRGADGLIESPLERVPALFLKKTAQSRGQRLTGEAVPVTENLYWIALSDQGDQVSRNVALLREGDWFGMPMLFKNGRGALVNFEKGIPGDQIFEAVLAAWEKAEAGQ